MMTQWKKNNTIWDNVSTDTKKEFDNQFVYNETFLNTKIRSVDGEDRDFYDKKISKAGSNYIGLAVITIVLLKKMKTIIRKCF